LWLSACAKCESQVKTQAGRGNPKMSFIAIREILRVNASGIERLSHSLIRSLRGAILFFWSLGNPAWIELVDIQSATPPRCMTVQSWLQQDGNTWLSNA
jgi:hypothetical protein